MSGKQIFWVIIIVIILVAAFFLINWVERKLPNKHLNTTKFADRWRAAQQHCHDKSTWPLAIIEADKLLDDALKKRGFKGKSMGERLVSARKFLTDNDKAWFAHKLRKKLDHGEEIQLDETIVKTSLKGTRQALKDLGALE